MRMKPLVPLVRWDGLHLVLNMAMLEQRLHDLARHAAEQIELRHLMLGGAGDAIRVMGTVRWKGMWIRVGFELAEIRLRHRHLGLRIRRVRAFTKLAVPIKAIEIAVGMAIKHYAPELVRLHGQGIVIVDLRQWLPAELALTILTVQATDQALHVWFGPGELGDVPGGQASALGAGRQDQLAAGD